MGGQNGDSTRFGQALWEIARRTDVNKVVEIGTWDGQGSTLQLVKGLASVEKANPPCFTSFEADPIFYEKAKAFWGRQTSLLEHVHVEIVNACIGTRFPKWSEVSSHPGFVEQMKTWFENESALYHAAIPKPLPPKVDMVLLDGGEYTTTGDWEVAETARPRIVALNNCLQFKGEKVYLFLAGSPDWVELSRGDEPNGTWAIFERISETIGIPKVATPDPTPHAAESAPRGPLPSRITPVGRKVSASVAASISLPDDIAWEDEVPVPTVAEEVVIPRPEIPGVGVSAPAEVIEVVSVTAKKKRGRPSTKKVVFVV